jgi:hypothetical protein
LWSKFVSIETFFLPPKSNCLLFSLSNQELKRKNKNKMKFCNENEILKTKKTKKKIGKYKDQTRLLLTDFEVATYVPCFFHVGRSSFNHALV